MKTFTCTPPGPGYSTIFILYKNETSNETCDFSLTDAPCVINAIEAKILKEACRATERDVNGLDVYSCIISPNITLCCEWKNPSHSSCSDGTGTCKYELVHFTPIIKTTSVCCVP